MFVFYTQIATRSRARIINAIRGPISRLVIYAFQKLQARLLLNPQVHSQFTFTSVQVHLLYHQSLFPPDNPPSSVRSAIQPHRQDDGHVGIPQCQRPVEGSYTNRGPQDHHCQLFLQTFPPSSRTKICQQRAASSSSSTASSSPFWLTAGSSAATVAAVGSVAWYYHLFGQEVFAMTPAEEG